MTNSWPQKEVTIWDLWNDNLHTLGLYRARREGSPFVHQGLHPVWSPDGRSLAFDSTHTGKGWQVTLQCGWSLNASCSPIQSLQRGQSLCALGLFIKVCKALSFHVLQPGWQVTWQLLTSNKNMWSPGACSLAFDSLHTGQGCR